MLSFSLIHILKEVQPAGNMHKECSQLNLTSSTVGSAQLWLIPGIFYLPSCKLHIEKHVMQGVTNINFRYERISEYICKKLIIWTNIQIYLYKKMIWYEWIFVLEKIWIYKYIHKQFLMLSFRFDVRCWILDV